MVFHEGSEASEKGQLSLVGTAVELGPIGLRVRMCCPEGDTQRTQPLWRLYGLMEVKSLYTFLQTS